MPDCFEFKEDDISITPVWAIFPSLPLECWHPNALGKIGSRLGTPIAMDSLTMSMERVSYARILVEVDASKKLVDQVEFCPPERDDSEAAGTQPPAAAAATTTAATVKTVGPKQLQDSEWTLVRRRNKNQKRSQQQYQQKIPPTAGNDGQDRQGPVQQQVCIPAAVTEVQAQPSPPRQQDTSAGQAGQGLTMQARRAILEEHSPADSASSTSDSENEAGRCCTSPLHMKIGFWNVRGFNRPLKHNGVAHLIKNNRLCLLGILETKLHASAIPRIIHRSFPGWCQTNNFDAITGGRILVIWNPAVIDLHPEDISPQVIHCRVTDKSSRLSFYVSFTYGLYTVVNRRSMWDKLLELGQPLSMPWLILGDFNCVKSPEEKQFGVVPTCPPGCLSDHSPGIVSLFDPPAPKPKPFRFYNMWADHPDFLATVESHWSMNVEGTAQFSLCRKLKALKGPLKAFNNLHYSHISVRAKEADLALQDAQVQLESDPENVTIRGSLGDLRKKATFLAEAERQFYYQKAKIHHLKMGDKNTNIFHDMVKRNTTRSSIMAISKSDGSTITSAEDIGREFTDYFTLLLGTEARTLPVDNDVFEWGPKLSTEHALELCRAITPLESSIFTAGIQDNELQGILERTEFARGEMPVRYLGIPLAAQRLSVRDYSPLVDKIASSISKWAAKSLSFAGRLELIRSVIQGVECFWLQIFPLPTTVIEKIHRLCRNFLWNSRRAPVAWEEVCHPKEEGGLGIRHIQSWNMALLARVLWNIHRKADTLWVQWVNSVYLRGSSIWDWQPKKGDSPLLRRLADIRDRLITAFGTTGTAVESMTAWSSLKGLQTSKAYEYFRPKCARQPWKAAIWRAFIPPKYSFILWLGLRGRLATRDRLDFLDEEHSCSLCINTMESTGHLFFACPFSDHVWSNIRQWLGITRHMSTLHSAIKWLKKEKMGSSVQNKARTLALACTVYSLWRHRNEIIFEGKAPNPDGLIACIKITVCRIIFALFPYGF
ncbi:hypothetical protein Salat_1903600 [Sesamum alatum]|uniref:Reverse transcriptase zinc-binding domain-containing protein n=1 Tax=Sesamum alatum TaxID=300844 RepID=A0AAE1Y4Y5_9LAMI|nr:hypothetical protein Salat_1903600 [Sesamum alatum]